MSRRLPLYPLYPSCLVSETGDCLCLPTVESGTSGTIHPVRETRRQRSRCFTPGDVGVVSHNTHTRRWDVSRSGHGLEPPVITRACEVRRTQLGVYESGLPSLMGHRVVVCSVTPVSTSRSTGSPCPSRTVPSRSTGVTGLRSPHRTRQTSASEVMIVREGTLPTTSPHRPSRNRHPLWV